MTDIEFQILDELYFLQSFTYLSNTLGISDADLKSGLAGLLKKGWIRCYKTPQEEVDMPQLAFKSSYRDYFYLASKSGLLAHNSRD